MNQSDIDEYHTVGEAIQKLQNFRHCQNRILINKKNLIVGGFVRGAIVYMFLKGLDQRKRSGFSKTN